MKQIKILGFVLLPVLILLLTKQHEGAFLFQIPLMLVVLWFMYKHQAAIGTWFRSWPLPAFITAMISFFPFLIYEESINCLPSGCKFIPDTTTFLTIFTAVFLILTLIVRARNIKKTLLVYSLIGLFIEFTYGVGVKELWALPPHLFVFFVIWVFLSYAYIGLIPINVLLLKQNKD
jgi:hypothetical protein